MEIFQEALIASEEILQGMEGRAADNGASLPWVASMAVCAGPGDHVEIGTLFGASAIAVALTKKRLSIPGKVYCIDPFESRVGVEVSSSGVPPELKEGTPEAVLRNAEKFGVELEIIRKKSIPWPEELGDKMFASGYIDGWHVGETPYQDFLNMTERVEKYIGFDNYEEGYPDVVNAVHKALLGQAGWFLYFKQMVFVALRRRMAARMPGTPIQLL